MGLFRYRMHNNPKLAEQLMFSSTDKKISEINDKLWKKFDGSRSDYYLNIVKICGKPITPRARYVIAMAYSWNSALYCKQSIYYLELYLSKTLYHEKCISNGIYSTKERTNLHLTEMYNYLGNAYRNNNDYDNALKSYFKAAQYTPNLLSSYLRIAEIYDIQNDLQKSIEFLEDLKHSKYAKFSTGNETMGKLFLNIEIIDRKLDEYKQRLYIQTQYPYNQKQVRELVMAELQKQNTSVNLTQPKLKLICDYFKLKGNNKYFYNYPNTGIYRCSQGFVDLLVNSLSANPHLAEEIKAKISK